MADRGSLRAGKKVRHPSVPRCYHWPCSCGTASHSGCVGHDGNHPHGAAHTSKDVKRIRNLPNRAISGIQSNQCHSTNGRRLGWLPNRGQLKAHAQQRRGNGPRKRVGDGSTPIPKSEWNSGFLKNEDNKKELFTFISRQICKSDLNGTLVLSIYFDIVLTNRNFDVSGLQPCNHAEANTGILLHLADAAVQDHSKAYVRTVDSDIVVLALRFFDTLGLSLCRKEVSQHSSSLISRRSWSVKVHRTDSVPQPNGI